MASPVTKGGFPDSLDPVFNKQVPENFKGPDDLIPSMYGVESSSKSEERVTSISGLPNFPRFTGALAYRGPDQGFDVTATHVNYAMGVQIGQELWEDDQHGQIKKIFAGFGRAAFNTRQIDAANLFNSAFSTGLEFFNHTEGVALSSNSHTTPVSGVSTASGYDNLSTAGLSATALTADRFTFRLFKDFQGNPIDEVPDMLYVPAELDDEAQVITRTSTGLDTSAGDVNVQKGRYQVVSSVRFTDANNYFVGNKRLMMDSFVWYERIKFNSDRMEAFDTYNFKGRARMRYSYLWLFWQAVLGHQVA